MNSTAPKSKPHTPARRPAFAPSSIYTPIPKREEKVSWVRWLGVLVLIGAAGWCSGLAFSAWSQAHLPKVATSLDQVQKIRPLPTFRSPQNNSNDDNTVVTDVKDSASSFADNAFGTGQYRKGELLFSAGSADSLEALIARAQAAGGTLLGLIRGSNSARFSFPDAASMARFLRGGPGDEAVTPELNYTVSLPTTPDIPTDPFAPGGLSPFGASALSYMGVPADNSNWGHGVMVAMLDEGLSPSAATVLNRGNSILQYDMTGGATTPPVGHGDMVASLLVGANGEQGIVPAAPLVSVRVLDSSGQGDVFSVSDGIYTALDQGAKVINLSLGTTQASSILQQAVDYALSQGAVIVAAAGNDGNGQITYPAAYPGVLAVGSIDATGQRATFSDYGAQMGVVAPGVGINTVTTDGTMSFSGTSASSPLVAGAIAGLLSTNPNLSGQQAVNLITQYADFAGPLSANSTTNQFYGNGIVDLTRITNRSNSTYSDVALADMYLNITSMPSTPTAPMQITVQNRGNTVINAATLNIDISGNTSTQTLSSLQPNEVRAVNIDLPVQQMLQNGVQVTAQVSSGVLDANISNNTKSKVVRLVPTGGSTGGN